MPRSQSFDDNTSDWANKYVYVTAGGEVTYNHIMLFSSKSSDLGTSTGLLTVGNDYFTGDTEVQYRNIHIMVLYG